LITVSLQMRCEFSPFQRIGAIAFFIYFLNLFYCLFQVNLIEWLKMMVTSKRAEEVVDPNLEVKPPKRALKRAILVGFKCVDPDVDKRPKMSHVVQMLESVQNAYHQVPILS
jgi:hypothetical protein